MTLVIGEVRLDLTLTEALSRAAARWPDDVFLRMDGEDTPFADFQAQTARLAAGLQARGVGPGTQLLVFMRNSRACVQTWFAANWIGAVWVPVNTEWRGVGLAKAVRLADPTLIVVDDDLHEALLEAFPGQAPCPVWRAPTVGGRTTVDALAAADAAPAVACAVASDPAGMLYTSGTTGRSKACVLSHRYFVSQAAIAIRDFGLHKDDVLYCPFPLFHADATALTVVPALLTGATAAVGCRFSASRFWEEVRAAHATVFDFMGATLSILNKAQPRPDDGDNSVRLAWGVPVPDWAPQFEQRFRLTVVELYGSVEANIPITQRYDEERVAGSCGRVTPEFEIRVADSNDDPVPANEVGQLLVRARHPHMMLENYFKDPAATATAFGNLWFHTGDLVRVNEHGDVFFVGRLKDAIRRRGENISAFEVEEGLLAHDDVMECAAIGVPSDLTEEEIKVFIVPRNLASLTAEALWKFSERTMARFQVPRYVEFVQELPKTPTGKISKVQLPATTTGVAVQDREATAAPGGPAWNSRPRPSGRQSTQ